MHKQLSTVSHPSPIDIQDRFSAFVHPVHSTQRLLDRHLPCILDNPPSSSLSKFSSSCSSSPPPTLNTRTKSAPTTSLSGIPQLTVMSSRRRVNLLIRGKNIRNAEDAGPRSLTECRNLGSVVDGVAVCGCLLSRRECWWDKRIGRGERPKGMWGRRGWLFEESKQYRILYAWVKRERHFW